MGCAVLTGWGAARAVARVGEGSRVAVWGAGAVGLSTIMACRDAGAATIIAVDTNPGKLELALRCGATHALAGGAQAAGEVARITMGGVDWGFECTGVGEVRTPSLGTQCLTLGTWHLAPGT